MLISLLFSSTQLFVAIVAAIIIAMTIHEFAHAFSAYLLGDHTAKEQGRLTFNPLAHLDFLGLLMLLLAGIGWGKPVPFNPYNLRYKRWGPALVSLAGPLANLILVFLITLLARLALPYFGPDNLLAIFLFYLIFINFILMVFNLLPIPPLDGSKLLFVVLPARYEQFKMNLERYGLYIILGLLVLSYLGLNVFGYLFSIFWDFSVRLIG